MCAHMINIDLGTMWAVGTILPAPGPRRRIGGPECSRSCPIQILSVLCRRPAGQVIGSVGVSASVAQFAAEFVEVTRDVLGVR